jgi:hypothetical protein
LFEIEERDFFLRIFEWSAWWDKDLKRGEGGP